MRKSLNQLDRRQKTAVYLIALCVLVWLVTHLGSEYKGKLLSEEAGEILICEQFSSGRYVQKTYWFSSIRLQSGKVVKTKIDHCEVSQKAIVSRYRGVWYFNVVFAAKYA